MYITVVVKLKDICHNIIGADNPPKANAGEDVDIQLPRDSTLLDGRSSTDDRDIVSYSWSLTSGDGRSLSLTGENTPQMLVEGLQAGNYVFTLTVTDALGQTDKDDVMVSVAGVQNAFSHFRVSDLSSVCPYSRKDMCL